MKLSTMRLPTGEFILVASEARKTDSLRDTMVNLKEATGAAAFFATDDVVEVEDAIVDADCRRREPEPQNTFSSFYFPNLHIDKVGTLLSDGTVTFEASAHPAPQVGDLVPDDEDGFRALTAEDLAVTRAIMEGQEFSPAGLVIGDHRLLHGTPPAEEQGTPGADPEPDGNFNDDLLEPLGEPVGPYVPRAGDHVVVNGRSWLQTMVKDFRGVVEEIPERAKRHLERSLERDGYTVRVQESKGRGGRTMYFRPEDVALDEEAQNG